jgi:hypothetical protein
MMYVLSTAAKCNDVDVAPKKERRDHDGDIVSYYLVCSITIYVIIHTAECSV